MKTSQPKTLCHSDRAGGRERQAQVHVSQIEGEGETCAELSGSRRDKSTPRHKSSFSFFKDDLI